MKELKEAGVKGQKGNPDQAGKARGELVNSFKQGGLTEECNAQIITEQTCTIKEKGRHTASVNRDKAQGGYLQNKAE